MGLGYRRSGLFGYVAIALITDVDTVSIQRRYSTLAWSGNTSPIIAPYWESLQWFSWGVDWAHSYLWWFCCGFLVLV